MSSSEHLPLTAADFLADWVLEQYEDGLSPPNSSAFTLDNPSSEALKHVPPKLALSAADSSISISEEDLHFKRIPSPLQPLPDSSKTAAHDACEKRRNNDPRRSQAPENTSECRKRWAKHSSTKLVYEEKKKLIYRLLIIENKTQPETISLLKKHCGAELPLHIFKKLLSEWGYFKNQRKESPRQTADASERHVRTRSAKHTRQVARAIPRGVGNMPVVTMSSRENLVRIVIETVGRVCPKSTRGVPLHAADLPHTAYASTPTTNAWRNVYFLCEAITTLARVGTSAHLNLALQRLFRDIAHVASDTSTDFLLYFWRISFAMRNIRCFGEQRLQHNKHFLFILLLRYLVFLFTSVTERHPFFELLVWLNASLTHSALKFKDEMEWVHSRFLICFQETIGDDHPIVLGMMADHRRYWRTKTSYKSTSIRMLYDGHLQHLSESTKDRDDVCSLRLQYMRAMSLADYVDDLSQVDLLATKIYQEARPRCRAAGCQLRYDLLTKSFIESTECLSNSLYCKNDPRGHELLEDAIEILRQGDQPCRIWAASFSRRKTLWYKSTTNYPLPQDDESNTGKELSGSQVQQEPRSGKQKRMEKINYRIETQQKANREKARQLSILRTIHAAAVVAHGDLAKIQGGKKGRKKDQALVFRVVENSLKNSFS